MSTRSTQTSSQYVSIGLQTDSLPGSRGAGLHSKAWSPRPSSTTTSSLASARTRQISTSLDKVHSRIERPCCSPKYGSPKLQRRVSSGRRSLLTFNLKIYLRSTEPAFTIPLVFQAPPPDWMGPPLPPGIGACGASNKDPSAEEEAQPGLAPPPPGTVPS